jgi:hypothetical protein
VPFTPSHAVVALPFVRTPLVPAAIAVGAMAPDLPLFLRGLPLHYGRTHSLEWLPATILVALALLLVWRCALRPAVRELSPRLLAERLPVSWDAGAGAALRETFAIGGSPRRASGRGILLLVVSLALGIVSHVVWDLFTHEGRWGVRVLPLLAEPWGPLVGVKWLQHGSSLIGLLILGVWALLWLRRQAPVVVRRSAPDMVRVLWWVSLPVFLGVAWVIGLLVYGPIGGAWRIEHNAYRVLPPACAVWGVLTAALSVGIQIVRARTRAHEVPADSEAVTPTLPRRGPSAAAD